MAPSNTPTITGLMARLDQRTQEMNHDLTQLEVALLAVLTPVPPSASGPELANQAGDRVTLEQIDERLALLLGRIRTITSRVAL